MLALVLDELGEDLRPRDAVPPVSELDLEGFVEPVGLDGGDVVEPGGADRGPGGEELVEILGGWLAGGDGVAVEAGEEATLEGEHVSEGGAGRLGAGGDRFVEAVGRLPERVDDLVEAPVGVLDEWLEVGCAHLVSSPRALVKRYGNVERSAGWAR